MPDEPRFRPTLVQAPRAGRVLEITFADGHRCAYPHDVLRGYCPCAECQDQAGRTVYRPGGDLELCTVEQVGNYGLGLRWADGHGAGVYTYRFLRGLGALLEQLGPAGVKALGELPRA